MRRTLIALAATTLLAGAASAQQATTTTTEVFVKAKPTDVLSSNLIDLNIINEAMTRSAKSRTWSSRKAT